MKPKFPKTVKMDDWMVLGEVKEPVVIEVESKEAKKYLDWNRKKKEWEYLRERKEKSSLDIKSKAVMVFGPSGSGKDVVTETIEAELKDEVVHIASDWYYGPLGVDEGRTIFINNYDHVNSVDWDLLKWHLESLKEGYEVNVPVYDFSTHSRMKGECQR